MKKIVTLLFSFAFLSCSSLSEKGKLVTYVMKQETPKGCKLVHKVEVGRGNALATSTVNQLKTKMRNETGDKGGNFLVIDAIDSLKPFESNLPLRRKGKGSGISYAGIGRAYQCP